jgi:hypothetical protein
MGCCFFSFSNGVQGIWVWPLSYTSCYIPPSVFADSRMVNRKSSILLQVQSEGRFTTITVGTNPSRHVRILSRSLIKLLTQASYFLLATYIYTFQPNIMTDAWFENAIETDGPDGEGCRREEAMTLKQYLRNQITVSVACQQITQPTENCPSPGDPLLCLWGLLHDALIELPNCQTRVIDLLLKIQKRPDVRITQEQREGALSDAQWTLWKDLPHFGHGWFDLNWWVYCSHWRIEPLKYDSPDTKAKLCNIACADALFAVSGIFGDRECMEGLARLADTLEDKGAMLDIEIIIVKEWLLNAGDMLFETCKEGKQHCLLRNAKDFKDEFGRKERELWKGDSGASLERWRFWKERLGQIEKDVGLMEETREAARVSLEVMDRYR